MVAMVSVGAGVRENRTSQWHDDYNNTTLVIVIGLRGGSRKKTSARLWIGSELQKRQRDSPRGLNTRVKCQMYILYIYIYIHMIMMYILYAWSENRSFKWPRVFFLNDSLFEIYNSIIYYNMYLYIIMMRPCIGNIVKKKNVHILYTF